MKVWICNAFGEVPQWVDAQDPVVQPGQVQIDVAACGVNFADTLILQGKYQKRPNGPFSPGFEVSGTVRAVGNGVSHVKPGDAVMAMPDWGGYAEQVVADGSLVMPLPNGVDFKSAAAFQIAYGTSWFALKYRADVKPGEVVLVHGAAGGVGLTAVECAKLLGATVIATAGGTDKCQIVRTMSLIINPTTSATGCAKSPQALGSQKASMLFMIRLAVMSLIKACAALRLVRACF